jgi:DNA-directed RNA polymerase subunit RPC12/RpoP
MLLIPTRAGYVYECPECSKRFDPSDIIDSLELAGGHDCEVN